MHITLNEALSWQKTLKERRQELVNLRNQNVSRINQQRYYPSANAEEPGRVTVTTVQEPTYNALALDQTIAKLAREERILETAIKRMNAKTIVEEYDMDDSILGELTAAAPANQ